MLGLKKRSANIEFYIQTTILSKGINKRQLQTKTKTKKNKQTNKQTKQAEDSSPLHSCYKEHEIIDFFKQKEDKPCQKHEYAQ